MSQLALKKIRLNDAHLTFWTAQSFFLYNIIDFGETLLARLSEQHHVVWLLMRGTKFASWV